MAILNYTTTIDAAKTAAEIEVMLAKAGVQAVLKEYGPTGDIAALSFRIATAHGLVSFRLPLRTSGVLKAMVAGRIPRSLRTEKQATRVAMRIAKDWIEAQLAIVEAEMADMAEVFLPYAQTKEGTTVYVALKDTKLHMLALEGPK